MPGSQTRHARSAEQGPPHGMGMPHMCNPKLCGRLRDRPPNEPLLPYMRHHATGFRGGGVGHGGHGSAVSGGAPRSLCPRPLGKRPPSPHMETPSGTKWLLVDTRSQCGTLRGTCGTAECRPLLAATTPRGQTAAGCCEQKAEEEETNAMEAEVRRRWMVHRCTRRSRYGGLIIMGSALLPTAAIGPPEYGAPPAPPSLKSSIASETAHADGRPRR